MNDVVGTFVFFFAVIDPVGTVPVFLAVTRGYEERAKPRIAVRATLAAAVILVFFAVAGEVIGQQRGDDGFILWPPELHVLPVLLDGQAPHVAEIEDATVLRIPAALPHPVQHPATEID